MPFDLEHAGNGQGEPGEQGSQPWSEGEPAHGQGNQSGTLFHLFTSIWNYI